MVEDGVVILTEGSKKKEHALVEKRPGYKYYLIRVRKINDTILVIVGYV